MQKYWQRGFHLNGHTIGFHPQTQKVKITLHVFVIDSGDERVKTRRRVLLTIVKFNLSYVLLFSQ